MKTDKIAPFICTEELSIVDAMRMIDANSAGILYIVDENDRLLASVTDGDLRRWIIKTGDLSAQISSVVHKMPFFLYEGEADRASALMDRESINSVPIVDSELFVKDIVFRGVDNLSEKKKKEKCLKGIPVIIMAGGKGTRLRPYTNVLPKPLIPIGNTTILERIMNKFYSYGADSFYLILNYKRTLIKAYFEEIDRPFKIVYVDEGEPLGTAGGMSLIDVRFDSPVIITNCDIIVDVDYNDIIKYHTEAENDMTIVSSLKDFTIPYGVLQSDTHGMVKSVEEKPRYSFPVNTGMYVIEPNVMSLIPKNRKYHMTELIELLLNEKKRVAMYPIGGASFFDMGEFEEMEKMEKWVQHTISMENSEEDNDALLCEMYNA